MWSVVFCGMTRAFIEISNGNFSIAYTINKASLYIYFIFAINFIIFIANIIYKQNKKTTIFIDDT